MLDIVITSSCVGQVVAVMTFFTLRFGSETIFYDVFPNIYLDYKFCKLKSDMLGIGSETDKFW